MPFRCKQWGCSKCNYGKRWNLKFKIDEIAHFHNTRYFTTLTMTRDVPLIEATKYFSNVFSKFRKRYSRHYKGNFKFIRITELHKDGYPHFHILHHQRINTDWLRKTWVSCGGGKIMKSIHLKPKTKGDDWKIAISKYLSKYFSKANHILPKGYRHYTTNYKLPLKPKYENPHMYKLMVEWNSSKGEKIIKIAEAIDFGYANMIAKIQKIRKDIIIK